jgi:ABC-type polysaccharide/polyol phosphate export permease
MKADVFIELLKQDLKHKYFGSVFGVVWAFLNPLLTIFVMWIVFQYGFNKKEVDGYPYILWFGSGMVVWLFFSDALINATYSIKSKAFLLKKTTFEPIYLILIKIINSAIIHLVLIIFLFIIMFFYKINFSVYCLQIIY